MEITFDRKTVGTCLQQRFILPTYQREYKWETKHLRELLTDIQEVFLDAYDPAHGREDVGSYPAYFMGTIITTTADAGTKSIIDGQQRLTTLLMIMAFFSRIRTSNPDSSISNIDSMLRRQLYGKSQFNIEFDQDRAELFSRMVDVSKYGDLQALDDAIDTIPDLSESSRRIFALFRQIDDFLVDEIKRSLIPFFVDYLIERVYIFEIGVPKEQDGHKVFVTMNDRGLKLTPIDLLKGHFLSNINSAESNRRANEKWTDCVRDLRKLGPDEDSDFFKTWLRAQYARTIRGKNRGDQPGDFELIGDSYHRWVIERDDLLDLKNSDQFYNFIESRLPFFAAQYRKIRALETSYQEEFSAVFHNGSRELTLQYMAILSSIDVMDSTSDLERKIRVVSYFIDYYATMRVINLKDNNYDNIRDYMFSLCLKIRRKPVSELVDILANEIKSLEHTTDGLARMSYGTVKNKNLLHILARFADFLENGVEQTNRVGFAAYVDRNRGARTFDVEHVIPSNYAEVSADLGSANDFATREFAVDRDQLGALILLPRGRNRSLKATLYSGKLPKYAGENILAQTLTDAFFDNNPQVAAFKGEKGLVELEPVSVFNKAAIEKRFRLYKRLADLIWNEDTLRNLAK
ncbi:DUF262 domain-containing protein [Acidocella facilis]|uniref:DUF262 domain-containing protein n=1 Tax=Acidocella facilis TaxID=525 RepID=UPI001F28C700|nr:DUF262 domain-containing protein [Acidocella facilis]